MDKRQLRKGVHTIALHDPLSTRSGDPGCLTGRSQQGGWILASVGVSRKALGARGAVLDQGACDPIAGPERGYAVTNPVDDARELVPQEDWGARSEVALCEVEVTMAESNGPDLYQDFARRRFVDTDLLYRERRADGRDHRCPDPCPHD